MLGHDSYSHSAYTDYGGSASGREVIVYDGSYRSDGTYMGTSVEPVKMPMYKHRSHDQQWSDTKMMKQKTMTYNVWAKRHSIHQPSCPIATELSLDKAAAYKACVLASRSISSSNVSSRGFPVGVHPRFFLALSALPLLLLPHST